MEKTTIIGIAAIILITAGVVWIGRPDYKNNSAATIDSPAEEGALVAENVNYDFGKISMAAGDVKREFKIKNAGGSPVAIQNIYTSCMCTSATLKTDGKKFGPYGMPGHGFAPKIGEFLSPGKEAIIEVVFDPAAHGPAGVGPIQRSVIIENDAGKPVELTFSAIVTP